MHPVRQRTSPDNATARRPIRRQRQRLRPIFAALGRRRPSAAARFLPRPPAVRGFGAASAPARHHSLLLRTLRRNADRRTMRRRDERGCRSNRAIRQSLQRRNAFLRFRWAGRNALELDLRGINGGRRPAPRLIPARPLTDNATRRPKPRPPTQHPPAICAWPERRQASWRRQRQNWTWSCDGTGGGANASCSAPYVGLSCTFTNPYHSFNGNLCRWRDVGVIAIHRTRKSGDHSTPGARINARMDVVVAS